MKPQESLTEISTPTREEEQAEIIRRLEETGEVMIARGGGDELVV